MPAAEPDGPVGAGPRSGSARRGRRVALAAGLGVVVLVAAVLVVLRVANPNGGTPSPPPGAGSRTATPSRSPVRPAPSAALGKVPIPAHGAYFGIYTSAGTGGHLAAVAHLESLVGRRFDIDHMYYKWQDVFPTADDVATAQAGRIPFLAWSSTQRGSNATVKWADIASGKYDALIDARADAIRRFGRPMFLTFQHEPAHLAGTGPTKAGTAQDYVNAWRHIVAVFRQRGVTNVSFVWTLTAFSFRNGASSMGAERLYPGDDVIDWIAADGYNQHGCAAFGNAPWRSFKQIFRGWLQWAQPHHKPLMVAEYGVQEDPAQPGRKGDWFRQVAQQLPQLPEIKAVVYYNAAPACPNLVTSSSSALAGFRALAQDSYLRPLSPEPRTTSTP